MRKKNHLDGKKSGGKHTTLTDFAAEVVSKLEKLPEVQKISPGIIKSVKGARGQNRVKLQEEEAGFKLTARGNAYIQLLHVYTTDKRKVASHLESCFECVTVWSSG